MIATLPTSRLTELADACLQHLRREHASLRLATEQLSAVHQALRRGELARLEAFAAQEAADGGGPESLRRSREELQRRIAGELDLPLAEAKIDRLAAALPEPHRGALLQIRREVEQATAELRRGTRLNLHFIGQSLSLWEQTMHSAVSDISMSLGYSSAGGPSNSPPRRTFVTEI